MSRLLGTMLIGLGSGVLSGMFGIGGGIVTTPAIRFFLGVPALVAVGTPLVAIIPSAVTGAVAYGRSRVADVRSGVIVGVTGSVAAVAGAWATRLVGGSAVLVVTAALILYMAADMVLQVVRPPRVELEAAEEAEAAEALLGEPRPAESRMTRPSVLALLALGAVTGLYSGFLGLGGGVVLVPLLVRSLRFPMKRAVGTSLVAMSLLAVPGAITHAVLGNIDWAVGFGLAVGVVPGALLGARITLGASERAIRIAFAAMLFVVGIWLGVSELAGWAL